VDALEVLAGVAGDAGSHQKAVRLLGTAQLLRDETGYRRCVSERDADIEDLRATLGGQTYQHCIDEGRSVSVDEWIADTSLGLGE
jgi:hypothetical protein